MKTFLGIVGTILLLAVGFVAYVFLTLDQFIQQNRDIASLP